jgi:uncharacterized protein YbaP (TraB family)
MAKPHSVLFQLTKKDSDIQHYIFGTMHLNNADAYAHVDLALPYIDRSQYYYAEMDIASAENASMLPYFYFPEGKTLSSCFKPNHFRKMSGILKKAFDIQLENFEHFIPFFVQTAVSEAILNNQEGLPLDYYLWQYAKTKDKYMGGVESMEEQIHVLRNIPLSVQVKSLRTLTSNVAVFRHKMNQLSTCYKNADIRRLFVLSKKQLGSLRALMLTDRNHKMANFIMENTKEESSFFAIGAAHLAGKKGIVNLLKKQGFTCIPLYK